MAQGRYSFSRENGAKQSGVVLSPDLEKRIKTLCNVLEMNKSSLLRFLINRGVDDLEKKLVERADKLGGDNV